MKSLFLFYLILYYLFPPANYAIIKLQRYNLFIKHALCNSDIIVLIIIKIVTFLNKMFYHYLSLNDYGKSMAASYGHIIHNFVFKIHTMCPLLFNNASSCYELLIFRTYLIIRSRC